MSPKTIHASRHEITTDGRTVWVNSSSGMCIGRFSRYGVDVHHDAETQMSLGKQCLACTHDLPNLNAWKIFIDLMKEHHGVDVPANFAPAFLSLVDA